METGFIKLYRKMTEWEWYSDNNVFRVFLHLLLTVNYKDKNWQNVVIKRGQKITSVSNLAEETGLTNQKVRTALEKLKNTKNVTIKTTNKYTLITVENYSKYQDVTEEVNKEINKEITSKQQTNNKQITTTKESKESKKEKKYIYGEFKHVKLTETEYKNLVVDYGEEKTSTIVTYLDEYMEMKDKKYKSCYLAIKKWVVEAVEQNNKKSSKADKVTNKYKSKEGIQDLESYYDNL